MSCKINYKYTTRRGMCGAVEAGQRWRKGEEVGVYVVHVRTTFECVTFKSHWMIEK